MTVRSPTEDLVRSAIGRFDADYEIVEQALRELFRLFPENTVHSRILLKVVTLNRLYSTQIFAVSEMARHIFAIPDLDEQLSAGSLDVVRRIATISIQGKSRNCFSFATKYCSWHYPESYPVYDSRVDNYLWSLQKQELFTKAKFVKKALCDYPKFREIMISFREHYGLGSFTFKEIDKFLWMEGERIQAKDDTPAALSSS